MNTENQEDLEKRINSTSFIKKHKIAITVAALVGLLAAGYVGNKLIKRRINSNRLRAENASVVYAEGSLKLKDPVDFDFLNGVECSRYARLAARHYFGKEYQAGNAWDLASVNRSVWKAGPSPSWLPREGFAEHLEERPAWL